MDEPEQPAATAFASWAPEVKADETGQWLPNGTRFATKDEAQAYVFNLRMRWLAVTDTRVVQSTDPVNYTWDKKRGPRPLTQA